MRLRGKPLTEAEEALGEAPETEFTFLLVPMHTFKIAHMAANQEDCSVGEVFQKALLQYLRTTYAEDEAGPSEERAQHPGMPEPTIVLKRRG